MSFKRIAVGQGFDKLTEAVTTEYRALLDLVRQALRDKLKLTQPADDYYVDIQGVWHDHVVCMLKGRLFSYPYTLSADNAVTIGDGTEVVLNYQPVRESLAGAHAADQLREAADGSGEIECTVIRAGVSKNGVFYSDALLQASVPLFEGVRVFSKPDAVHTAGGGKDVNSLHGGIYAVRFVPGAAPDTGSLVGRFRGIDPADPVVVKMTEAVKRGMAGLFGLSIDADARIRKTKRDGQAVREALAFVKVHSVDLIVEPGAGGGLDRLTEATDPNDPTHEQPGEAMLKKQLFGALVALAATQAAAITLDTATEDQVVKALREACAAHKPALDYGAVVAAALADKPELALARLVEAAQAADTQRTTEAAAAAAAGDTPVTRAELATHQARLHAVTRLAECTLPQVAKDKLRADLLARDRLTEAQVDAAINAEREYLARFTESGRATGGMPRIEVGDRSEVMKAMLDAFFDPAHKDHKQVRSIRECYAEMTGDRHVTGDIDRARLAESVGSDTFAQALGNSLTRRMQAAYNEAVAWQAWRQVVTVAPVNDFRTQERTEIGGFGNIPIVAERGAYVAASDPSDDAATYAVAKRGGLLEITMEAIKNDDVGAIRRLPVAYGRAAARTLYTFVFNFFAANAAIYDSVALYHASHANLFTTAFSAAQFAVHRLAMMKQNGRDTSNRMGIGPKFLLGPMDLEEAMVDAFRRNTNNDKTFVQSLTPTVIPVATWTDLNDWVTLADPMDLPVLELGFLDGNEEPVLLTQDSPTEGKVFTNDIISYKLRHVYGGTVLVDGYKGTTKAVVA